MSRPSRVEGFTLIEILIVVSIIALLMSMVAGAVILARKKATESIVHTQVDRIAVALDQFKDDEGFFPGADYKDPQVNAFPAVYEALLGRKRTEGGKAGRGAPYLDKIKEDDISVYDEDLGRFRKATFDERMDMKVPKFLLDAFGSPYWYRLNKGKKPESYMHNIEKFDLWSLGPDKENQTLLEEEKSDDIGNW